MTRYFLRLVNYLLLACFLGSLWGGWYLSRQGFGRKWRKKLSEEFSKRGVELTTRRLTLDPLRGLVARNVRVFRDADHEETVAMINELHLDINYTRLLRNEPFLDALILSEAEVLLDLDPQRKKLGEFTIHHLSAQLYFQQDKLEIRRLQGEGLGLVFSIAGVLEHRADWQAVTNPENLWKSLRNIPKDWLKSISEVDFGPEMGRLDLRFRGNLSQKNWLESAEARLEMPAVQWRSLIFNSLTLEGDFANRLLTIRRLDWRDEHGAISVNGNWQPGVSGHFLIDSAVNAPEFFKLAKIFPDLTSATEMRLKGDLTWTEKKVVDWRMIGELDAAGVVFRKTTWDRAQTHFSAASQQWFARELHLQQKGGAVNGEILSDHGRITAEIDSTVDPRSLWLGDVVPVWFADLQFDVNPLLKIKITSNPTDPKIQEWEGEMTFGRTSFRGVSVTSAQTKFTFDGSGLTLSEMQITRPEGQLTGEGFWNPGTQELRVWEMTSSLDLIALGLWIDRPLADLLESVQLPRGTTVQGQGLLKWNGQSLEKIDLQFDSDGLALFELPLMVDLKKTLPEVEGKFALQADISFADGLFEINPLVANHAGWQLRGQGTWNLKSQLFSGLLESTGESSHSTTWTARSPWNAVRWHKTSLATPLK